ncbi:MAG: hypothetical protein AB7Q97_06360 [Gammaproteobacteria bacterium]
MITRRDLIWMLALGLLFEAATAVARFGLDLHSTRDTAMLARWTFGLRIHHGYIGLLLLAAATRAGRRPRTQAWLARVGGALLLSDLMHHCLVLWPLTGSPQFDLTYPPR